MCNAREDVTFGRDDLLMNWSKTAFVGACLELSGLLATEVGAAPKSIRGWSPRSSHDLFAEGRGPVAQRLEQGTHNWPNEFCAHLQSVAQWVFHR